MSYIAVIAGARPNFMKVAPLLRELRARDVPCKLIHTGQHYDEKMSEVFFQELEIPAPDVHLGVGSGTHATQTAEIMVAFEALCIKERPSWTLVVGDVNSTVACALVAAKLGIKVCHLEAGLRSRDWAMPEEINRVVTDRLSDLLLTPSSDADENLLAEGVPAERIKMVGNIMIDTLMKRLPEARHSKVLQELEVTAGNYALVTLHRPSNVDTKATLAPLIEVLLSVAQSLPVVLPLHPRTRQSLERHGLMAGLKKCDSVILSEPKGYLDFLALSSAARLVITDSGGLQEETTVLGVPCLTVRENTERPITVSEGTNQVVGTEANTIKAAVAEILAQPASANPSCPPLWDGKTAARCVDALLAG